MKGGQSVELACASGVVVGIVCLFFLVLVLPLATPAPVKAYNDPKIATSVPKDPGTPFEEPEIGGTGSGQGDVKPGGPIGGNGRFAAPDRSVPATAKVTLRKLFLQHLIFVLWHQQ